MTARNKGGSDAIPRKRTATEPTTVTTEEDAAATSSRRTGTLIREGGKRVGRIRLKDGSRPRIPIPDYIKSTARAHEYVNFVQEREDRDGTLYAAKLAKDVARARLAAKVSGPGETFEAWSRRWIADRKERGLRSWNDDEGRFKTHLWPTLGSIAMESITRDQLEDIRDALDRKVQTKQMAWKTSAHVWGTLRKCFDDATNAKRRDLRVLTVNPATGIKAPDRGSRAGKQYLYPDEFLKLVSCERVALRWRRVFAIAVYMYARDGEVKALDWNDVNLDVGVVHIHKGTDRETGEITPTKTGETRRLPIEANLMPLLRHMRKEADGKGQVVDISGTDKKLARQLRRCLLLAGVDREELHKGGDTRRAITFHDLRATGITWCAVRGDDPLKIKQRAGHSTFSTTEQYIREAENLSASFGTVFPPLPDRLFSDVFGGSDGPDRPPSEAKSSSSLDKSGGGAGNRTTNRISIDAISNLDSPDLVSPSATIDALSSNASDGKNTEGADSRSRNDIDRSPNVGGNTVGGDDKCAIPHHDGPPQIGRSMAPCTASTDPDDALRGAIAAALAAGQYDRAQVLLNLLRDSPKPVAGIIDLAEERRKRGQ